MEGIVEQWRPVVGYEGLYEVSSEGRVKGPKGLVKPKVGRNGYARTELWRKGNRHRPSIHRLVAQTFIPNPDGKPQVNHIDGNKLNNAILNLEWCTAQENMLHSVALHKRHGANTCTAKLTEREVIAILVMLEKGVHGKWLADVFGVTNAQITNLRLKRQWRELTHNSTGASVHLHDDQDV